MNMHTLKAPTDEQTCKMNNYKSSLTMSSSGCFSSSCKPCYLNLAVADGHWHRASQPVTEIRDLPTSRTWSQHLLSNSRTVSDSITRPHHINQWASTLLFRRLHRSACLLALPWHNHRQLVPSGTNQWEATLTASVSHTPALRRLNMV